MEEHLVKGKLLSLFTLTLSKPPSGIWATVIYYFILNEGDFIQIMN